jgi:hypothetical protein
MADLSLLLEAEKRGLLPEDKKSLLNEARTRGLVPAQEGAPAITTEIPAARKGQSAYDRASAGDIIAGLPATRMLAGAAAPIVGAAQVGANIGDYIAEKMGQDPVLGKYLAEKIGEYEASKKRGMAALGDTGTDLAGIVGAGVTGGLALRGVTPAATYGGRIAQGTAVGAGAGATTPTATPGLAETGKQTVIGATLGGAIPAVTPIITKGSQAAYRTLVEPFTNPEAIKGRAYMEAAGEKAPEIINALRASKPVVPGSLPTAGEAAISAGRPEFSALQASAERVLPTNYLARSDARNAARSNQLGQVAGTEADRAAAEALRKTTATQNYNAAMTEGIDLNMAAALQPQIQQLMERPVMKSLQKDAAKWAADRSIATPDFGSLEGLDYMKKALDRQIAAQARGTASADVADLQTLMMNKEDLLAVIKEIAPKYDVARGVFATQSKPINQMEVGQYLRDKLTPALDETASQRAASFAGAVRDAPGTLKRSLTNAPRYEKLSDVLTPDQIAKVESVRKDLANMARQEMMAQKGAQAGPNAMDIATQSITGAMGSSRIPNPLSRIVTVANALIARFEGKINKELAIQIATEMLDPKIVAAALEKETVKVAKKAGTAAVANKLRTPINVGRTNALINSTQENEQNQNAMIQ